MSQPTPPDTSYEPTSYTYETKTHLFSLAIDSSSGVILCALTTGDEKILFLEEHGEKAEKQIGVENDGRIMIPQKGAFFFFNVGQREYMVGCETELGRRFEGIRGGMSAAEKGEWLVGNAVRIREWPMEVKRVSSV